MGFGNQVSDAAYAFLGFIIKISAFNAEVGNVETEFTEGDGQFDGNALGDFFPFAVNFGVTVLALRQVIGNGVNDSGRHGAAEIIGIKNGLSTDDIDEKIFGVIDAIAVIAISFQSHRKLIFGIFIFYWRGRSPFLVEELGGAIKINTDVVFTFKKLHEFFDGGPERDIRRFKIEQAFFFNDGFDLAFIDKNTALASLARADDQFGGVFDFIAIFAPLTEYQVRVWVFPFNNGS